MINFAFCYEQDEVLEFVRDEILNCFRYREIQIAVMCYHNAYELQRCICRNCPDIVFYDRKEDGGLMHSVLMQAKQQNKELISIVTQNKDYTPPPEDYLLEPIYIMPDKSRRHLWAYASLAYETTLDDGDSFSYYVRPDYIHTPVKEIRYFASEGRRTHIVSSDYRDTFYQKLDMVEKRIRLKNCQFMRIHKSYLVNARYIDGYSRDYVLLTTGERLRISKYEYYKTLNKQLQGSKRRHVIPFSI
ncbi:hypothetical protein IMSAGC011_01196 [Lachnospiraceae bacterium]|nr:hypothetical protein IMSAGC011_01196 [Lachnospiraceae bacterium]